MIRGVCRRGPLACAIVAAWPGLALAQVAVQYRMLTLVESAGIYAGLAMQAVLRLSSLRQLPQVIVVCCTMWLVYQRLTTPRPQPFMGIVAYLVSCTLILVLFWPEAAPRFFGAALTRVFPGRSRPTWRRETSWGSTTPAPRAWCRRGW